MVEGLVGCEGPERASGGGLPGSATGIATALPAFLACGLGLGLSLAVDGPADPVVETIDIGAGVVGDGEAPVVLVFSAPAAASFSPVGVDAGLLLPLAVALAPESRLLSAAVVVDVELRLLRSLAASSSSGKSDLKTS